ncbi:MAG: ribosome biogenesis GTPase YlqF [Lachnospiraceae bacterium]|nr:ribosome biogenesis GTPase YlqF [Lachnospiraceae bacterium]HAV00722.1 ribosome biogenesis GTPase YlqF [Lachnospiraceae bacterium]
MNYQWYPGHMTKAIRMMQENIKLIDIVIELLDARIPLSSRNPDIDSLAEGKARLIVLNKADLAQEKATKSFAEYFKEKGFTVTAMDSRKSGTAKLLNDAIRKACEEKLERNKKKGIINRPMRAMVAGIPNVGKSTLINTLSGRAGAKTGNKPGVTKGKQWIRLNKQVELLDTPGILWHRFDDPKTGERLALIGSINDDILDKRELSQALIRVFGDKAPEAFAQRYGISISPKDKGEVKEHEILEAVAKARGALLKGGEADIDKAAGLLLDDFRSGRLGRITLDALSDITGN